MSSSEETTPLVVRGSTYPLALLRNDIPVKVLFFDCFFFLKKLLQASIPFPEEPLTVNNLCIIPEIFRAFMSIFLFYLF